MAETTPPQNPTRAAVPNLAAAPKVNPSTGRREAPVVTPPPVDQATVNAAVAAAIASVNQQKAANAPTPDMDKTIPGGVYIVDGVCVDCNGERRDHPDDEKDEDDKEDS